MRVYHVLLLLTLIPFTKCAKILAVFPSPGYSQFILGEALMLELVKRGHEVTVISPYKPKQDIKNYRPILVDDILKTFTVNLYDQLELSLLETIIFFDKLGLTFSETILAHQEVQKLIRSSNETFDLVIVEQFMNEAQKGLAPHFNAPLIIFNSMGFTEWTSHLLGNIRLPSLNPLLYSPYTDRMTFFERLHNTCLTWFQDISNQLVNLPHQQKLLTQYFPKKMNLKEVMNNVSVLLLNSHATTVYPSTLATSVIEIGGFHISPRRLPNDIRHFLDNATEGAIFFSMGTNIKSINLPNEKLQGILKSFSTLKQRILWKFEDKGIPNKPSNVLISKWLPQSDILAHPNVVAFITHGGLLSTRESIHFGVPMIGIPVFSDQRMNVALSVKKQIAVLLPLKELSEESLTVAIQEILDNPIYSIRAKEYSELLKDQIVKPMDLAMFWIEYVIRHKGAPHLRQASAELYWFQLYLLDVICFLIVGIVLLHYIVKLLFNLTIKYLVKMYVDKNRKQKGD